MCEKNCENIIYFQKDTDIFQENLKQDIFNILNMEYSISWDSESKINNLNKTEFLDLYKKNLEKSLNDDYSYIELIIPKLIRIGFEKKYFEGYEFDENFLEFFKEIYKKYEDNKFFIRDVIPNLLKINEIKNSKKIQIYFDDLFKHILLKIENFIKIYDALCKDPLDMQKRIEFDKLKSTDVYKYYITDLIPSILDLGINLNFNLENYKNDELKLKNIYYINN